MPIQRKHTMYHSTILDADPDTVWATVRDAMQILDIVSPGDLDIHRDVTWTEGGSVDTVPARYDFKLTLNGRLVQQEIAARDEINRTQSYRAVAPTSGVARYEATIRVFAITNDPNRSFFDWSRVLDIAEDADEKVVEAIIDVMEKQTDAVRDHFAKSAK
ncbi:SRPBCC family protein [Streptomyces sp. NBC_00083]|uniref:SRPBCC family protein n=1 Tax=Streptomyces sp. NBC_00083 TaxID=2975647 RepID=UPI00225547CD|nr:SRPBCC family protein [Streptomyces sp. NBC_00083]MCX5388164.1 SRPBCC family protein [Streptomyces sp. NBC_00083]